ncbi:uncharacterized protein STEHIDRAFT_118694 [Stereum hirsutum FP-91666 SS1]|uniref:uncharacterized protein n=1 Tax=Stereum hirsutum (strain FP-91666) TaxID=721885 RepID=UPI000440DA12|nr:uncharacterized protein STEHIDRAFT_118694 [Stereum hirsutum FP-91666 SS1]EIM89473.1 hypothetical protein STEHIDRAFT_118694 [Stereum hirsutum FP-91666 SS1]
MWIVDMIQTVPQEIDAIWSRKFTSTSALYFMNRYGTLLSLSLQWITTRRGESSDLHCEALEGASRGAYIVAISAEAALAILRVYAINERVQWIIAIAAPLVAARLAMIIFESIIVRSVSTNGSSLAHISSCRLTTYGPQSVRRLNIALPIVAFVFNGFIFVLTIHKTYSQSRLVKSLLRTSSISHLLLRDGAICFL